jgi:predicted amidohydrolase
MERIVRISAAQLPTVIEGATFREKQRRNLQSIRDALTVAGRRKSDLVVFGEYANLHHRTWSSDVTEYVADPIPGDFTKSVASLARKYRMNVVVPIFGTMRDVLSSWAVVINRQGKIIGAYQKSHPTLPEQKLGIRPGNDFPVIKLDVAKIGMMTCMDIEYPEVATILMLRGAELLLFPHVQATWGEIDWEVRYRARAIDTGLPIVSACYGYPEGEWKPGKMIGRSSVVGRDGLILADMGRSIGVLTYDLDLNEHRMTEFYFNELLDRTLAVIASRRPEIYRDLLSLRLKKAALKQILGKKRSSAKL